MRASASRLASLPALKRVVDTVNTHKHGAVLKLKHGPRKNTGMIPHHEQTERNISQPNNDLILQKQKRVLAQVRTVIEKRFGTGYKVETFGSVKYGATTKTSDMDLIILDQKQWHGFDPQAKNQLPSVYRLHVLAAALRDAGFVQVKPIPANVPIIKFNDPQTKIQCDINVNDQPGYWNTMLLKRYTMLCPHLTGLLVAIKGWAKLRDLNTPSPTKPGEKVTFSSFTFALMTVGFLQNRGLLPNLQEKIVPQVREHPFWNRKPSYLCDLRFNWHVQPLPGNGQISTAELYTDWFKFWADFDPTRQMVDIQLGGIIPRTPAEPILLEKATKSHKFLDRVERSASKPSRGHDAEALQGWEHQPICVIDPFVRVRNVAKNISKPVFKDFQEECRKGGREPMREVIRSGRKPWLCT